MLMTRLMGWCLLSTSEALMCGHHTSGIPKWPLVLQFAKRFSVKPKNTTKRGINNEDNSMTPKRKVHSVSHLSLPLSDSRPGQKPYKHKAAYGVDRTTISKILKNKEKWLNAEDDGRAKRRPATPKYPTIKQEMQPWLVEASDEYYRNLPDPLVHPWEWRNALCYGTRSWVHSFKLRNQIWDGFWAGFHPSTATATEPDQPEHAENCGVLMTQGEGKDKEQSSYHQPHFFSSYHPIVSKASTPNSTEFASAPLALSGKLPSKEFNSNSKPNNGVQTGLDSNTDGDTKNLDCHQSYFPISHFRGNWSTGTVSIV
ncbi:hypothetical protein BT96DRAFT_946303 [Gymnopus androsaceus JB14]|uniref:HTH psq-type domain-containing protein n=1 Tax=Gymnopus androsaceus JB14 TaxID=1447944 RepID=A0A6A4GXP3_9AGAR|nr:hypothetical protein BT96DRAFT_946303 [Gymnopus androsaceus JB14]